MSVRQTVLSVRSIDRTPVAFSSTIFPLYIPLPSCSRHHRQHAVIHFNSSTCRSNPIRDRRCYGASVPIYEMFLCRCEDLASCTTREMRRTDRSSVSLFLVYNDMFFFSCIRCNVSIHKMLLCGCKDRASCDSREIRYVDRSSVSLFLVYNDMLFFLVFNTLSLQNFKRGVAEFCLR